MFIFTLTLIMELTLTQISKNTIFFQPKQTHNPIFFRQHISVIFSTISKINSYQIICNTNNIILKYNTTWLTFLSQIKCIIIYLIFEQHISSIIDLIITKVDSCQITGNTIHKIPKYGSRKFIPCTSTPRTLIPRENPSAIDLFTYIQYYTVFHVLFVNIVPFE